MALTIASLLGGLSSTLISIFATVVRSYTKADFISAVSNNLFSSSVRKKPEDEEDAYELRKDTDRQLMSPNL